MLQLISLFKLFIFASPSTGVRVDLNELSRPSAHQLEADERRNESHCRAIFGLSQIRSGKLCQILCCVRACVSFFGCNGKHLPPSGNRALLALIESSLWYIVSLSLAIFLSCCERKRILAGKDLSRVRQSRVMEI